MNSFVLYLNFVNFLQDGESLGLVIVDLLVVVSGVEILELLNGDHSFDCITW